MVDGEHILDIVVVVGVDSLATDGPLDGRVDVDGSLHVRAVEPNVGLLGINARNLHLGLDDLLDLVGILTVVDDDRTAVVAVAIDIIDVYLKFTRLVV